jgi:Na+/H+ antiporter NhaA
MNALLFLGEIGVTLMSLCLLVTALLTKKRAWPYLAALGGTVILALIYANYSISVQGVEAGEALTASYGWQAYWSDWLNPYIGLLLGYPSS